MNMLPSINELKPILNDSPFYECGFNVEFDKLSFENKLQVLCDIVRQSIYPNGKPNPNMDLLTMTGNCYTSSYTLLNYLKSLNIGTNHRCVLVRKKSFELDEITSIHVVLLVDNDGHTYQVDSTPFVGYKYGSVDDITFNKTYEEYVLIDDNISFYLNKLRKIIYDGSINKLDVNKISEYIKECEIVNSIPILKGYAALALKSIKRIVTNKYDSDVIQRKINKIKPYNSNNKEELKPVIERMEMEYKKWNTELNDLIISNKDYKRQLELIIWINEENKWYRNVDERVVNINGNIMRMSLLNPRVMFENNLSCIVSDKEVNSGFVDQYSIECFKYTPFKGIDRANIILTSKDIECDYLYKSENYSECSLYFLSGFPTEQVMNKYMYPNKKLIKKY